MAVTLQAALGECETLLRLIEEGVETDDRDKRDAAHTRFLGRLKRLHGQVSETYFAPRLRSGAPLRKAGVALQNLWHGLVILDRTITDERTVVGPEVLRDLRPPIRRVQDASLAVIGELRSAIADEATPAPQAENLCAAIAEARRVAQQACSDAQRALGIHAVVFALDELEERIVQLVRVLKPGDSEHGRVSLRGADVIAREVA